MRYRIVASLVGLSLALAGCGSTARKAAPLPAVSGAASASAPARAQPPPTGNAPTRTFEVGVRTDTFTRDGTRVLKTTIWYAKGTGPFPVVLFSHGLGGSPDDYGPLLSKWAAAGFAVVAPAYPKTSDGASQLDVADVLNQPADASYVLTQVLAGPLKASLNPARIAAAGHSAGGITTVGLFTAKRDDRLGAGIVFAGASIGVGTAFAGAPVPLLFVHGDADQVVRYAAGKAVFDALPWPKALLTLPGQGHAVPLNESNTTYRAVSSSTVDFLRYALYGDAAARGRLGTDAKPGILDDRL